MRYEGNRKLAAEDVNVAIFGWHIPILERAVRWLIAQDRGHHNNVHDAVQSVNPNDRKYDGLMNELETHHTF